VRTGVVVLVKTVDVEVDVKGETTDDVVDAEDVVNAEVDDEVVLLNTEVIDDDEVNEVVAETGVVL